MSTTTDVVAEALAAIAPYKLFIAARRKEADEEAAKVKGSGTPVLSLFDSGSPTPPPTETPAEEVVLTQPSGAAPTGSGTATPSASAMNTPEARLQGGETPNATMPEIIPPTSPAVPAGVSPTSSAVPPLDEESAAVALPTTATEALAQFDAVWHVSKPERFPQMVQAAYAQREEVPDMFAQLMVGAAAQGYFSPDLERAVTDLVRLDAHFQAAHVLFQDEQFAGLFEIAMQDGDYLAEGADDTSEEGAVECMDETPADGEADCAVERGESPF